MMMMEGMMEGRKGGREEGMKGWMDESRMGRA